MLRLFFILLISLSSLFLSAQNQPPFRVVFWNTENFFDTRHDSLKNDMEFLPHSMRHWNHRRYKKKLDNVARTLTAIGEWNFPALIGLCEVENDTVMRDLTLYSPLKEAGYRYVMTHCSDLRGIDVALLYQRDRFKLLSYLCPSPSGKFQRITPDKRYSARQRITAHRRYAGHNGGTSPFPLRRSKAVGTLPALRCTKVKGCSR